MLNQHPPKMSSYPTLWPLDEFSRAHYFPTKKKCLHPRTEKAAAVLEPKKIEATFLFHQFSPNHHPTQKTGEFFCCWEKSRQSFLLDDQLFQWPECVSKQWPEFWNKKITDLRQVLSADQLFQSGPKGGIGSPQVQSTGVVPPTKVRWENRAPPKKKDWQVAICMEMELMMELSINRLTWKTAFLQFFVEGLFQVIMAISVWRVCSLGRCFFPFFRKVGIFFQVPGVSFRGCICCYDCSWKKSGANHLKSGCRISFSIKSTPAPGNSHFETPKWFRFGSNYFPLQTRWIQKSRFEAGKFSRVYDVGLDLCYVWCLEPEGKKWLRYLRSC